MALPGLLFIVSLKEHESKAGRGGMRVDDKLQRTRPDRCQLHISETLEAFIVHQQRRLESLMQVAWAWAALMSPRLSGSTYSANLLPLSIDKLLPLMVPQNVQLPARFSGSVSPRCRSLFQARNSFELGC